MTISKSKEEVFEYWKSIVEANRDALVGYLQLRVRNSSDVNDIIHDTYLKLTKMESYRDIQNPKAYLFRTAISVMIDNMRSNTRRSRLEGAYRTAQQLSNHRAVGESTEQEDYVENKQRLMVIRDSLDQLPQKCRAAFLLYRFHNMKQREIAASLGVSVNSVERYIIRAVAQCRDALSKNDIGW